MKSKTKHTIAILREAKDLPILKKKLIDYSLNIGFLPLTNNIFRDEILIEIKKKCFLSCKE